MRSSVVACAPLALAIAAGWVGSAGGAAAPAGATPVPVSVRGAAGQSGAKKPLSYWTMHPCGLIPPSEVAQVLHAPMGAGDAQPNAYGGQCSYSTTGSNMYANIDYAFDSGTAASARSEFRGTYHSESSVAPGAYCVAHTAHQAAFEANVGTMQGSAYHLNMAVETCVAGASLTKYALARIG